MRSLHNSSPPTVRPPTRSVRDPQAAGPAQTTPPALPTQDLTGLPGGQTTATVPTVNMPAPNGPTPGLPTTDPVSTGTGVSVPSPTVVPTPTTSPALAVATETDPGNFEYPDNVSAQYPINSAGGVSVTADFSGVSQLALSVACPGGQEARSGGSGLTVSVAGEAGMCMVILSEPGTQGSAVSYTLTVQYPRQ